MKPFTTCPHNRRNKEAKLLAVTNAIDIMQIHLDALKKSLQCPVMSAVFFEHAKIQSLAIASRRTGGQIQKGETYIIGERHPGPTEKITIKVKGN